VTHVNNVILDYQRMFNFAGAFCEAQIFGEQCFIIYKGPRYEDKFAIAR